MEKNYKSVSCLNIHNLSAEVVEETQDWRGYGVDRLSLGAKHLAQKLREVSAMLSHRYGIQLEDNLFWHMSEGLPEISRVTWKKEWEEVVPGSGDWQESKKNLTEEEVKKIVRLVNRTCDFWSQEIPKFLAEVVRKGGCSGCGAGSPYTVNHDRIAVKYSDPAQAEYWFLKLRDRAQDILRPYGLVPAWSALRLGVECRGALGKMAVRVAAETIARFVGGSGPDSLPSYRQARQILIQARGLRAWSALRKESEELAKIAVPPVYWWEENFSSMLEETRNILRAKKIVEELPEQYQGRLGVQRDAWNDYRPIESTVFRALKEHFIWLQNSESSSELLGAMRRYEATLNWYAGAYQFKLPQILWEESVSLCHGTGELSPVKAAVSYACFNAGIPSYHVDEGETFWNRFEGFQKELFTDPCKGQWALSRWGEGVSMEEINDEAEESLIEDSTDGVRMVVYQTTKKHCVSFKLGFTEHGQTMLVTVGDRSYHYGWSHNWQQSYKSALREARLAWKRQDEAERKAQQFQERVIALLEQGDRTYVVYMSDSFQAGNCRPGTLAWMRAQGFEGREVVPLKDLFGFDDPRVKRVVSQVIDEII